MPPSRDRQTGALKPCCLSHEEAIECLAQELNWKQEHLDPSDEGDWENYSDSDKEFFRACVKWLLCFPDVIDAALSNGSV